MASEDFTERVLRFIGQTDYRPQKIRALARNMGIATDEYGEFKDAVRALMKTGRIVMGSSRVLLLPEPSGRIMGKFRLNPRGFGFVTPQEPNAHGDLFIPPDKTAGALTGDTVVARIRKSGKRGGKNIYEGRIEEIVNRGESRFVGELCCEFGRWFVRPDGNTFHGLLFVDDPGAKSAREGDQVVVEVTQYPETGRESRGVIVRVLGERGRPEVDTLSTIVQYQFPECFDDAVLKAASKAVKEFDAETAASDREDLRDLTIITIDPDDARDFDDAISLEAMGDGTVELGVHIADVSAFVSEGSVLDEEARRRSTSVYFPKHVIPMLPEVLSNGVCSLQEKEPRLTKSAFIRYNKRGVVMGQRFANSVIRSAKRLTYRQATAILDGRGGRMSKKVVGLVTAMDRLAKAIRKRRIDEGMLVLDLPEVDLVFDSQDNVVGVEPADTSFSHTIIEMFMVEANEAVGRLLAGLGVPCLRRVHPDPDETTGESLLKFLAVLGLKIPKTLDRFTMQDILKRVKGKPESFAVNLALLRSMRPAEYSPKMVGHFALGGPHYVHFTSPIRRYPDLTIHRLLDLYLRGGLRSKRSVGSVAGVTELAEAGSYASICERRAEDAERELRMVKILRLLEERVGDEFAGVVTGVTNFGVFVQLREYLLDGLVRFSDLSDDWWEVDADRGYAVAERTGQRIMIGQLVDVVVARVNVAGRQLDLAFGESSKPKQRKKTKIKSRKVSKPSGRGGRTARAKGQTSAGSKTKAKGHKKGKRGRR